MAAATYPAYVISENTDGSFSGQIQELNTTDLPPHDILIQVRYSSLNYKDALSASGNKGVTRTYPHTPGIDAVGQIMEGNEALPEGSLVIVTGYDLGMNTPGGFGEYIRVPAEWVIPLPEALSPEEAIILGTAGFTAAIGLYKMERQGQHPAMGPIVITGASGGVGSLGVSIFSKAGYEVHAVSGKEAAHDYLRKLGAKEVFDRNHAKDESPKALLRPRWAGALDTVGGNTLHTLLRACQREGSVASCGLVESPKLPITVFPFILNGVNLLGIDSATFEKSSRLDIWKKLSTEWKPQMLTEMATWCTLEELPGYISHILAGQTQGRILLRHGK